MKSFFKLGILALYFFSQLAHADIFDSAIGVRARSREDAKNQTAKLIQAAKAKLSNSNHRYEVITGGQGDLAREVIVITPDANGGTLNRLAKAVQDESPYVRVVYDAYPLLFGTVAFFDPKALTLGVSHNAMAKLTDDDSVEHERYHARTYLSSLRGKTHSFSGELSTLKSNDRLSSFSDKAYLNFQGLDEGITQALSLSMRGKALERAMQSRSQNFDLQWELTLLNLDAEMCSSVARQVESVAKQILSQNLSFSKDEVSQIEVYGRKFAQIRIYFRAYTNHTSLSSDSRSAVLKLNLSETELRSLSDQGLKMRFERIRDQSSTIAGLCLSLGNQIPMGIERADVGRTNVQAVIQSAKNLETLVRQID